ncbi:hypothetical protein F5Y18DRAFT_222336 [Xylariaceae sp. FL1019]|nr:hypothetical protein F5Y18DRAFT_222336 [Xylariaceae sp. FL1019]
MDDSTRLVSELLNKLAELDQKVFNYRQDMAHEFQRYSRHLLTNVPEHVSAKVEETIAGKLLDFPALRPGLDLCRPATILDPSTSDRRGRHGRASPPPILPHTSGIPPITFIIGGSHSPIRQREREFHGLFTPSYLPLLEAVQPQKYTLSASSEIKESNLLQEPSLPLELSPSDQRPSPIRRITEDTVSSTASDDSLIRSRRSSLRRSSSATKGMSPRRVRFDFEGKEVLTTVSPPLSPRLSDSPTTPPPDDTIPPLPSSAVNIGLEKGEEETTNLLGNSPPRPKKISSTERLKAMARTSTEDTSNWTVVGEPPEDEDEDEGLVMTTPKRRSEAHVIAQQLATSSKVDQTTPYVIQNDHDNNVKQTMLKDSRSSAFLENTSLPSIQEGKMSSFVSELAPELASEGEIETKKSIDTTPLSRSLGTSQPDDVMVEEEEMFGFDEDNDDDRLARRGSSAASSKYVEEEDGEQEEISTPDAVEEQPVTLYSTSPAIPIGKSAMPLTPAPEQPALKQLTGSFSAGSYKGKPFVIDVVRNEQLHKQAAEMGEFYSFVGSVDGRSGVDPSNSYQHVFDGSPKSFGERLMEMNSRRNRDGAR